LLALFEDGYDSIIDGDEFGIAKVLKIDPDIVHVRIYKQHFSQRPRAIHPDQLTLGTIHDKDGFGMGRLPLPIATFPSHEPRFITPSAVTAKELEGCTLRRDAEGGVRE
jgi:hypothetical protein